jgi:hypothetical protein
MATPVHRPREDAEFNFILGMSAVPVLAYFTGTWPKAIEPCRVVDLVAGDIADEYMGRLTVVRTDITSGISPEGRASWAATGERAHRTTSAASRARALRPRTASSSGRRSRKGIRRGSPAPAGPPGWGPLLDHLPADLEDRHPEPERRRTVPIIGQSFPHQLFRAPTAPSVAGPHMLNLRNSVSAGRRSRRS